MEPVSSIRYECIVCIVGLHALEYVSFWFFAQKLSSLPSHQHQVSEALSLGIPVVMSNFTAKSFGPVPGCIGADAQSFKNCILDLHRSKERWTALRNDGVDFIRRTHSRQQIMQEWSKVIDGSLKAISACLEGEDTYMNKYPAVREAVRDGIFQSGFHDWNSKGKAEGREYDCKHGQANGVKHGLLKRHLGRSLRP
jgi:hypothetical protein